MIDTLYNSKFTDNNGLPFLWRLDKLNYYCQSKLYSLAPSIDIQTYKYLCEQISSFIPEYFTTKQQFL